MNELDLNGCLYVLSMIPVAHHSRLTANSTRHHHIMAFGDKKLVSPTHVRVLSLWLQDRMHRLCIQMDSTRRLYAINIGVYSIHISGLSGLIDVSPSCQ